MTYIPAAALVVTLLSCGSSVQAPAAPEPRPVAQPTAVRAGAFCSPVGAEAVSVSGRSLRCIKKPGQERARWRSAR